MLQSLICKITSSSYSSSSPPSSPAAPSVSSVSDSSDSDSDGDGDELVSPLPNRCPSFKIVGDNIDKYVKPREMRFDVQAKSLNYFNSYAVKGRASWCFTSWRHSHLASLPNWKLLVYFQVKATSDLSNQILLLLEFWKSIGIKHRYFSQKSEVVSIIIP